MFNFFGVNSDVDKVVDCFYNSAFKSEGEYLKLQRAKLIEADKSAGKQSSKLLVNNPNRKLSLRSLPFESRQN